MAAAQPRHIRIFLSSPGDVGDERALALHVLEALPYDPLLRGKVTIEAVAWDKPGAGTPMLATMTPQEAINQGLPRPSECDVVIVIFWSRMGTPLPAEYLKPDKSRYLSGTEWEYQDAVTKAAKSSAGLPFVVVYRRTEDPVIRLNDPDFGSKREQWERVEAFFAAFKNSDGSIRQGFNPYRTPEDFRKQLELHLKDLINRLPDSVEATKPQGEASVPLWAGSPFPGLRAFTLDDAPIFFGRGQETDVLLERVSAERFVAVVGASGSGKSSLVGAGLLPRLAANAISGSKDWLLPDRRGEANQRDWGGLRFTPGEVGSNPFTALAIRLAPLIGRVPRDLAEALAAKPQSIVDLMAPLFLDKPDWAQAVLFIDQFEELFTLVHPQFQPGFVALFEAITASDKLRVVLTLRADFYARCVEYPALAALLKDATFPLAAPGSTALFEMISRPAERGGLRFETGLVDRILQDTGSDPGALALMAFALDELYKTRSADHELTFAAYNAFGGVQGAIGERAEMLYEALDADAQNALFGVFRELVEVDERGEPTRRRIQRARVAKDDAAARLIDKLTEARLLVQSQGVDGQAVVEVAHEALLRNWPRLTEYITREKDNLRLRRQIEQAAQQWQQAEGRRKADYLLVGSRLEEAERWLRDFPADEEDGAFIHASEDARARRLRNLQQTTAGAILVIIVSVAAIVFAVVRGNQAINEVQVGNNQLLTATFAQGQAVENAAAAATQAQMIGETLTPVGPALTAVQSALQAGNNRLMTATFSQGQAQNNVATAQTAVAYAAATLTPVAQKAAALDMEAQAVAELSRPAGNVELAALLAIRSLKSAYYPVADNVLLQTSQQLYTLGFLVGHTNAVTSVVFSPDGKRIVTGSVDRTARLWDANNGSLIRTFSGHTAAVNSVAFSPDGKRIVTASSDRTARLWDADSGALLLIFSGHTDEIWSVAFSPDGTRIVTTSTDQTARLWDADSGALLHTFSGFSAAVFSAVFSPDGTHVLTGGNDHAAELWDLDGEQPVRIFKGHTEAVNSVVFSPDGKRVLTASSDKTAQLWDVDTGQSLRTFSGHTNAVWSVAFSPDGTRVLTGSWDDTARLWDVDSGQSLRTFSGPIAEVLSAAFSPDGKRVLTGSRDGTARVWDADSEQTVHTFSGHTAGVMSVAFSPDAKRVLTSSTDGTVKLWDANSSALLHTFTVNTSGVYSAVFSPDGTRILVGVGDGTAQLWDVDSGQLLHTFSGHSDLVKSAVFSPDGKRVLTGSLDHTARLWNTDSGSLLHTLSGHADAIWSVAFSPDGKRVLTGSRDGTARLWDADSGQPLRTFSGHTATVSSVAFSPNGKRILTGGADGKERIWDPDSGQILFTFSGHTNAVWSVAFSPDGKRVLSGSSDQTALLWDAQSGQILRTFSGHSDFVQTVAFSPDGKQVLTGSWDHTARLWYVDYRDLVAYVCSLLHRDMTGNERTAAGIIDKEPTCPKFGKQSVPMLPTTTPFPTRPIPEATTSPTLSPTPTETPLGNESTL